MSTFKCSLNISCVTDHATSPMRTGGRFVHLSPAQCLAQGERRNTSPKPTSTSMSRPVPVFRSASYTLNRS